MIRMMKKIFTNSHQKAYTMERLIPLFKNLLFALNAVLLTTVFASAQITDTIVSLLPSNRNVLLEEYTGSYCVYCPDGHRMASELANSYPGRVNIINIYQGMYDHSSYTTQFGDALATQSHLSFWPSGTINRHVFIDTITSLGRNYWNTCASQILEMPSPVNIAAEGTLDWATRTLNIRVQLYYTAEQAVASNALNIAIIQDNVLGFQDGGSHYDPNQMVGDQYSHKHMLRHLITGQWGDSIPNISVGTLVEKTYEYVIPGQLGSPNPIYPALEDLRLIAFVCEGHQEVLTSTEIPIQHVNLPAILGHLTKVENLNNMECNELGDACFWFRNVAATIVTSLTYSYSVNGGAAQTISWNGSIPSMSSDTIHIPVFNLDLNTNNTVEVQITAINGVDVDIPSQSVTIKKNVYTGSGEMTFTLVTDRYASETTFNIFDPDGNVVLSGGPWDNLTSNDTTVHEFSFEPQTTGCYRLEVYDSYGDGINSGYGSGYFKMMQKEDSLQLFYDNGEFDRQATYMIDIVNVNTGGIVYVTPTGAGTHSGDSWANAISSIDSAISIAQSQNAMVWVAAGTYYGDTTAANAFTMVDGVSVYGGFAGNEPADYDLSLRDFEANATILDGDSSRRVLYQPMEFQEQTEWNGFTIRKGLTSENGGGAYLQRNSILTECVVTENQSTNGNGGGVYAQNTTISNCIISGNTTLSYYSNGGGIYANSTNISNCLVDHNTSSCSGGLYVSGSRVDNCTITNNTATRTSQYASSFGGGGVGAFNSTTVSNCQITNNHTNYMGGGLYAQNATIKNCNIENNTANVDGGGVSANTSWNGYVNISHCVITNNRAPEGGGVAGRVLITNSLVANNTAANAGGGISNGGTITNATIVRNASGGDGAGVSGDASTTLTNCIVWGNERNGLSNNLSGSSINCSYSAIEGGCQGEGIISLIDINTPMFVNPSLTPGALDSTENVDWHLQQGSVCVNRGNNLAVTDTVDLDGMVRVKRDTVDLGCYESDYYGVPMTDYDSIVYVTVTGAGTHSGNSWENATSSIENAQAIALAYNAVVWVAAGTYYGDTVSSNAFTMKDGVSVYGGFVGNEPADYDLTQRDFEANTTILDGQHTRRVLYQPFGFNTRTEWNGFTIQNGQTSNDGGGVYLQQKGAVVSCQVLGNSARYGGGINAANAIVSDCQILNNASSRAGGINANSTSVLNCDISNNTATETTPWSQSFGGGGVGASASTISNCRITNNHTAHQGGGVYASSTSITNCYIENNTANVDGGGVHANTSWNGYVNISHCVIANNRAPQGGGVIGGANITNCLIANNTTTNGGGGVSNGGTITNTTIVRNASGGDGAGVSGDETTTLTNCIVWGNERNGVSNNLSGSGINCSYSAIEGGYHGAGNLNLDSQNIGDATHPAFVSPTIGTGYSFTDGDWHLTPQSVCINMGSLDSTILSETDLDGLVRVQQGRVDMGCYETQYDNVGDSVNINVMSDNVLYGNVLGGGTYNIGDTVTLRAVTNQYARFLRWNDNDTTNPRRVIAESDTTFVAIFELYLPELHVTSLSHSELIGGSYATVTWTVQNDGTAPTPNGEVWYDRVWLSLEPKVDVNNSVPIYLGEVQNVAALAPGEYYTQTKSVWIPLEISGDYYLFVISDAYDVDLIYWDSIIPIPYNPPVYISALSHNCYGENCGNYAGNRILEFSEYEYYSSYPYYHDNFFYEQVDITMCPLPDLVVTSVSTATQNFFSGSDVMLTYQVVNDGDYNTRITEWYDVIFISNHDVFDETAQVLKTIPRKNAIRKRIPDPNPHTPVAPVNSNQKGEIGLITNQDSIDIIVYQGPLEPDSSYERHFTVTIPLELYGTAYFYVYTDYYNQVYEHVGQFNNVTRSDSVNIYLTPPADLVPQNLVADNTVSTGATFNYSYEIHNQGAGNPNQSVWNDRCYLSTSADSLVDAVEISVDHHNGSLSAGGSYSVQKSMLLPPNITNGTYYLFVLVDANNSVFEYLYEENNLATNSQPITVVQPDLQILSLNVEDTLFAGAEVGLSYMLANTGDGAIINRNVKDGFYLSQYPDGANAITLPQFTSNLWLNAHDSTMKYQNVMLPGNLQDGNYYLFARTNIENTLNEANTGNNISPIQQVYVVHRPLPDLLITSVSLPDTIVAGSSINFMAVLTNQGDKAVNINLVDYRLTVSATNNNINCPIDSTNTATLSLAAGATTTVNLTATILPSVSANPSSFTLTVNPNHSVAESNYSNNGYAFTHSVQPYPFDMVVTYLASQDQIISGDYIPVEWTIENIGSTVSNVSLWYDRVYLSLDSLFDANDVQIGSHTRNQLLNAGDSYTVSTNCQIPVAADGDYYILVVSDATQETFDCLRANNVRGRSISVTQSTLPDLQMDSLMVNNTLTTGQSCTIHFSVSNEGEHITHNDRWTDAFYQNNQPTIEGALLLGSKIHNGQLDVTGQYTDYVSVIIPNSWIGNSYLIGFTDATNQIVEMNSDSNNLFILPVSVARPLPSDLTVLHPDIPDSATIGEVVEVSWTLRNIGLNAAQGNIKEAVYLSTDSVWSSDDIMLGSMEHDVNLAANGQELRNASLTLQGVPVGNYFVIVKTNILNALNENSYTNNRVASLTTLHVDYPSLYINQEEQLHLESSQTVYYKLEVGPEYEHQTLSCKLTSPIQNVMNSLYVSYSSAPSTSNFDWSATMPYVQEQEILIPSLAQGTYYIMVKGHTTDNSIQSVTLLASIINFEIISVNANSGTNTGSVTTQIIGAKFDTIMDFRLANSNSYLPAEKVFFHNSTESYATFNLRDQETGVYDMVAELPGGIITVKGQAFVVETGLPAELLTNIIAPASVRNGNTFTVTIEYGNNGSTDLNISGFLLVSTNGFPIAFESDSLANNATELTFETAEPNGNPDVIRPGHFASKTIFVKANRTGNINLKLYPIRRQY